MDSVPLGSPGSLWNRRRVPGPHAPCSLVALPLSVMPVGFSPPSLLQEVALHGWDPRLGCATASVDRSGVELHHWTLEQWNRVLWSDGSLSPSSSLMEESGLGG